MELFSTHADVSKTDFVDRNGSVVYRIHTDSHAHLVKNKTTIAHFESKDGADSQPETIAEIAWRTFKDDLVTFRGHQFEAESFMPNHGITTAKRDFKATSGRAYYWVEASLHAANGVEVARWHEKSHSFTGRAHQAYLYIADLEILDDLDEIVLVLVYHLMRYSARGASNVNPGTAGEQATG
ncbi:unnamed protein product [Peniophora sp. CBMAI 1063]|nr:unnamed protein product [Peniophora sp. CBMAI 1063]